MATAIATKRRKTIDFRALSGVQLAEALGKGRMTVTDWFRKGCPRNADGTFDIAAVEEWRISNAAAVPKENWEVEGQKWRALKHKHELETRQGKFIETNEAAAWWADRCTEVRTGLQSLGAALSPALVGQDAASIRRLIDERCRAMCESFARQMQDALDENEETPQDG